MTCPDCGCKVYNGACVNCHEETFILDQYIEQGMDPPSNEFLDKVEAQREDIKRRKKLSEYVKAPRPVKFGEILDEIGDGDE